MPAFSCLGLVFVAKRPGGPHLVAMTTTRCLMVSLCLSAAAPVLADPMPCPGGSITVDAGSDALRTTLCQSAETLLAGLAACHLPQQRPINIVAVDEVAHPFATCLAAFDCDYDRIRLVVRDDYTGLVAPDDPYANFPPDILLHTLLSHELTHALIEQNSAGREVPLVDHEYMANALELEQMAPEWRQAILDYAMLEEPNDSRIDIWIYRLEPRRFAANAWLHFIQPENGCDLVGRLVSGEASFEDDKP
ncbi:hypothetical protein GCM10023209_21740 [Roseibacterium beibuensis]|uniref:Uncharacterized protein n=2 Tax=[Roseibacterium] beibuensis TaxID=1193142 RepID=A0ABP9LAJ3_9RHOB